MSPAAGYEGSNFSTFSPMIAIVCLSHCSYPGDREVISKYGSVYILSDILPRAKPGFGLWGAG